jgi:phosphonoacetaldehyde hydrolase
MMWYAMAKMGIWPAETVVKVDDTAPGIGEGRAAGTWTVGVSLTGNVAGLSGEDLVALSVAERQSLRARGEAELAGAGADLVIDGIADLPTALDKLAARVARGERPGATRAAD